MSGETTAWVVSRIFRALAEMQVLGSPAGEPKVFARANMLLGYQRRAFDFSGDGSGRRRELAPAVVVGQCGRRRTIVWGK
jgi:hypothetical protein